MKKTYLESGIKTILESRYFKDTILLIATASNNVPTVRSVDTFYYAGSFWIVTDTRCNYVKEIQENKHVMISDGGHNRFWCEGFVLGHPLKEANLSIREVYLNVFKHWYHEVNNEQMDTVCFVKATPYKGYLHQDGIGYTFNIPEDVVMIDIITHHIDVKLEPFW